jgi:hypothetical protein
MTNIENKLILAISRYSTAPKSDRVLQEIANPTKLRSWWWWKELDLNQA